MATRTGLFFSKDYNDYKWDRPSSGYIPLGSGAMASGLVFDNTKLIQVNEFEGIEREEEFDVIGNKIRSSGTVTYHTYDA